MKEKEVIKITDLIKEYPLLNKELIESLIQHEIQLLSHVYKLGRDHGQYSIMNNPFEYIKKEFYEL